MADERYSDKGLLVISGGILQIPALVRARELGITTYLADGSDHCVAKEYADFFYVVDTKDPEANATLAKKLCTAGKIHGVYTQGADVEYSVAYAARAAGLPGIDPQAAYNCNNKIRTRELLSAAGMNHTPFGKAKTLDELRDVVGTVGFPCYIKPTNNSASRGMTRLENSDGLEDAFVEAVGATKEVDEILVEREIPGEEYSVDTVLYKGVLYPAGVSDRAFLEKEKYAVQTGSRTPSLLPAKTQDEMYGVMRAAAEVLGVTDGAFKGDLVVDPNGVVKIIEVTARTSGGFDSQYRKPLSFGIDLIKATMDIALGLPLDPLDLVPRWVKWSSTVSVFPEPGVVQRIVGVEEAKKLPGVAHIFMLVKEGETVEPYVHSAKRTNFVICTADTYEQLLKLEAQVQNTLIIQTTVS